MAPQPPPPLLTLDNFNIDTEVPENCPFVLTSPRSLEACRRAGVQPVSLLPTTLAEYEAALPELGRERVLQIFREVETAKEVKLGLCREFRQQLIWEEDESEAGPPPGRAAGSLRRKLSCLSPIVEHVGGAAGRDSALGTSNSGTASGSQETDSPPLDDSPSLDSVDTSVRNLRSATLSPAVFLEEALVTTCTSDQPESDQHLSFPLIQVQGPDPGEEEVRAAAADSEVQLLLTSCQLSQLSQASLESDGFYSDLVFSETPSPVQPARQTDTDWRSCPELDKETVAGLHQLQLAQLGGHQQTMERTISRSAHTIKVCDGPASPSTALSPTYRRTPTRSSKKKASRCERLTSDSLQSLYEATPGPEAEAAEAGKTGQSEDECPEAERTFTVARGPGRQQSRPPPWRHSRARPRPWVSPANSNLVRSALSRSDIDIDQLQISQQDLRLLEILTIRNNAEHERQQKQHKLRIQWEEERCQREAAKTELEKEYRRQLTAKRRKESDYCARRLEQARERFIRSQDHLRQLLKEKDDRNKVLLDTLARHKETLLREHREQEESRRLAVDYAVKDLLARDTQYRNELKIQLEEKMKKAEKRRKQNETDKLLSITEARRLEAEEHQQRMKKLEELYDDHIEKIKRTIEKKIKQSQDLLNHHKEKNQKSLFTKNTENYTKTLALKAELEGKLDLWRKQVLSVQSLSIRRAEEKVRSEIDSRREKLAEEMRTREMKCFENRREKEQEKKKKLKITKMKIEEKDRKVEKLLNEREQSILRARKMAETSAKLREIIKSFQ